MISIFTIPKGFSDKHITCIQKNAVRSWQNLEFDVEIFYLGDDIGVKEASKELNIKNLPAVQKNLSGIPLLNSAFHLVKKYAKFNLLLYINADIILLKDFKNILKYIPGKDFVMAGRRWRLEVNKMIDFSNPEWSEVLKNKVYKNARLGLSGGIDYFLFKKHQYKNIPAFMVGRVGWDNWMIYEAKKNRYQVIDISDIATAIHQEHDYSHLKDGGSDRHHSPEAEMNINLAGGRGRIFTLDDAEYVSGDNGLVKKKLNPAVLKRYIKNNPEILPGGNIVWLPIQKILKLLYFFKLNRSSLKKLRNKLISIQYKKVGSRGILPQGIKRIYHYHIRKSGGTSLNFSFFNLAANNVENFYYCLGRKKGHCINENGKIFVGWNKDLIEYGNYFYGFSHIPYHQVKIPEGTFTLTILRDPVKRVISHYQMLNYYVQNRINHSDVKSESLWLGKNFSDFLQNIPKDHLLRQLYMFSQKYNINEAEENINSINHLFMTDNFSSDLDALGKNLNLKLKYFHKKPAKIILHISDLEKEELETKLEPEIEFYKRIVQTK